MVTFFLIYKFIPDFVKIELEKTRHVYWGWHCSTKEKFKSGSKVVILIWLLENYVGVIPFSIRVVNPPFAPTIFCEWISKIITDFEGS